MFFQCEQDVDTYGALLFEMVTSEMVSLLCNNSCYIGPLYVYFH